MNGGRRLRVVLGAEVLPHPLALLGAEALLQGLSTCAEASSLPPPLPKIPATSEPIETTSAGVHGFEHG